MNKTLFIILFLIALALFIFMDLDRCVHDPAPETPIDGEALWYSLPPELLSDVIAGKQEKISDLEDDIARIQEIQREQWEKVQQ